MVLLVVCQCSSVHVRERQMLDVFSKVFSEGIPHGAHAPPVRTFQGSGSRMESGAGLEYHWLAPPVHCTIRWKALPYLT